jgi:hypothetical protein
MKDADNDDFVGARKITRKSCASSTRERELQCLSESGFGAGEKISGE